MAQVRLSKAEFARLAGVSKPAITKAVAGALREAVDDGEIDAHHPAAVAYLAARGKQPPAAGAPTPTSKPTRRGAPAPTASPDPGAGESRKAPAPRRSQHQRPRDLEQDLPKLGAGDDLLVALSQLDGWQHRTVLELVERYGTLKKFAVLLDALKTWEDIRKAHLHNEETEGSLISRDLVRTHVVGTIEATHRRLLSDAPKTITRRLFAALKSSESVEEGEQIVRDIISSILRPERDRVTKALRDG